MADLRSRPAKRSWGQTVGFGIFGVICVLVSIGGFSGEAEVWIGVVAGILALGSFGAAAMGKYRTTCFACDKPITQITGMAYGRCTNCGAYGKIQSGEFVEAESDAISLSSDFLLPVGGGLSFPNCCARCGKPSTQTITVSATFVEKSNPNAMMGTARKNAIEVPHCKEHKDGAQLTTETPKVPGGTYLPGVIVLKVSSHAFYRKMLEQNRNHLKILRPDGSID